MQLSDVKQKPTT